MEIPGEFRELIELLIAHEAEFLLVGSHALAFHGRPRYTEDIDLWISRTQENSERVSAALAEFGVGVSNDAAKDFTKDRKILQLGVAPRRIDILTFLDGCDWSTAHGRAMKGELSGLAVKVLSLEDYVLTKRASGRPKDLLDLELLREQLGSLPGD
ncbi:MAG: nucleotidyl transferase AbiEii/AbiGii toxin family protein [Fimbriimonadaceae bacterium]|nr:MAG: nucleotidyl transferase AbiEii/AbiGii toxin family protein [Fimbriimonadaceae bacterium]